MSPDVYRYDVVDGVALFDLTEFGARGGAVLEEFFETVDTVLADPDAEAAVFVLSDSGGISKWFFQRFDSLAQNIERFDVTRVAFVGPAAKQVALRGRLRDTGVTVETPDTPREAVEWARGPETPR